ncbi:MAG TPA: tRNA (guanosine(37)-N1)-methyltransferase TrmD [Candidatus Limnocylindrales bacterium]|nr:tRNA (guanosine(37)-N1)-methyltransferase TrmD [Candidatus Limnocylindrales bacterium]
MRIDVFTLFPAWFDWFLSQRHVRNALGAGNQLRLFNYRDSTPLGGGQVDDSPYGGGAGMVLRVDAVDAAIRAAYADGLEPSRLLVLSASGRQLDDGLARDLASEPHVALLSGRYEGIDERVRDHLATDAVSIGPYVLSGGELASMVVTDAIIRKLPGALGHADSAIEESFSEALEGAPEYPHYTRPASYRGWSVPDVLLSGDHARVREWRLEQSRKRARAAGTPTDA